MKQKKKIICLGLGCINLLTPSEEEFKKLINFLEQMESKKENRNEYVGPDEKLITKFYEDKWTHLSSEFGFTSWKETKLSPYFLHFVSEKPWNAKNDWPDFKIWNTIANRVVDLHKEKVKPFFVQKVTFFFLFNFICSRFQIQ